MDMISYKKMRILIIMICFLSCNENENPPYPINNNDDDRSEREELFCRQPENKKYCFCRQVEGCLDYEE